MADDTALWNRIVKMGTTVPGGPLRRSWPIGLETLQQSLAASDIEVTVDALRAKLASPPADFPYNVEIESDGGYRFTVKG